MTRRIPGIFCFNCVNRRWLRHHPKVLAFEFAAGAKRPDKANAIDLYVSGHIPETKTEREQYEATFKTVPEPLTEHERTGFLQKLDGVACSSDAFFPFPDNIHRLAKVSSLKINLIIVWCEICSCPGRKCTGQDCTWDGECTWNGICRHRSAVIYALIFLFLFTYNACTQNSKDGACFGDVGWSEYVRIESKIFRLYPLSTIKLPLYHNMRLWYPFTCRLHSIILKESTCKPEWQDYRFAKTLLRVMLNVNVHDF